MRIVIARLSVMCVIVTAMLVWSESMLTSLLLDLCPCQQTCPPFRSSAFSPIVRLFLGACSRCHVILCTDRHALWYYWDYGNGTVVISYKVRTIGGGSVVYLPLEGLPVWIEKHIRLRYLFKRSRLRWFFFSHVSGVFVASSSALSAV